MARAAKRIASIPFDFVGGKKPVPPDLRAEQLASMNLGAKRRGGQA